VIESDQPCKILEGLRKDNLAKYLFGFWCENCCFNIGNPWFDNIMGSCFADVGVALLAILNAVRLQNMNWD